MPVSLPTGVVPANATAGVAALTTNRVARFKYELLDGNMAPLGTLDGVRGSSLAETANATLKRGGNMAVTDLGQLIDWPSVRFRASYEVDGYGSWGVGAFVPSMPSEEWSGVVRRWSVQVLDVATVLAEDRMAAAYTVDVGVNIVDSVRALIEGAGEVAGSLTGSTKTVAAPRVWEAGASRLEIINALLDTANYFALFTDGDGNFRAEPYSSPASRPIMWEFVDGANCVYRSDLTRERDQYGIPNRVTVKSRGTGTVAGLVSVADNTNPASPWSIPSVGRVKAAEPIEVDAADQVTLDAIAARRLIELTTPTSTITIEAMPVPVAVNDAVRFRRVPMGVDGRHVVSKIEYPSRPTGLAKYTLRGVAAV